MLSPKSLFTGPLAAIFYVLGCREPLKQTHEDFVAVRWRQVLGSTMHCAAGDGVGITAGAALAAQWRFPSWADFSLEYVLGFGFGWAVFQAFAMREMAGGNYLRSLRQTFLPELLSMNLLMTGMVLTRHLLMPQIEGSADPLTIGFWFVLSMALIVGFALAFPMNWWLVASGLKHGMITVRPFSPPAQHSTMIPDEGPSHGQPHGENDHHPAGTTGPSTAAKAAMTMLSIASLVLGIALASWING
ncbi:MAG: DUF4396 domain-containing protein [Phycicoccus sp.]|nr:DUF4396 domain-containing protein [Phycicoccus sp.]